MPEDRNRTDREREALIEDLARGLERAARAEPRDD